jgi:hypothetical protein
VRREWVRGVRRGRGGEMGRYLVRIQSEPRGEEREGRRDG